MSIPKKFISVIVSLALVAAVLPISNTQAITADELKAQIEALAKQLAELQQQLVQIESPAATVSGCAITSFDRNLKQGMTGDDVKCLQVVLNSAADTQVVSEGAGSPNSETTYFGSKTRIAVAKFQEKYSADILAPLGLTTGTGYVGLSTRTKLSSLLPGIPAKPGTSTEPVIPPKPAGAGLTVSLAEGAPVSGTIVAGQATADLVRFLFTNGDASEVKVTKLVLKRIGVSGDDTLENVYLFDGSVRITDAASVSQNTVTFANTAGLFSISAKGTKNINVKADIKTGTSGQTIGIQVAGAADVVSNASAIGGNYPISGNLMTIATATLAGADFTGATLPTTANIDPAVDVLAWQRTLNVSNRDIYLNRIAFREIGSVNYSDLKNFRLYVDGTQVGATVETLDSNGYVTFTPAGSYKLATGSRVIKVLADVVGGSSRNFSFSLRNVADIDLVDSSYNVNVRPSVAGAAFVSITSGTQGINAGAITVQKASDSPSGNVINNGSDVVLAKYTLTAYGEPVKIETLKAGFTYTDNSGGENAAATLRNGKLMANSAQVGSTATLVSAGTTFTTNLTVTPGAPVTLEIRADIYDNDGTGAIDNTDTIKANLIAGTSNAQGTNSLNLINVPSANNEANTLTVATGAITLAKTSSYVNQSLTVPQTAYKLGSFILTGNTTEDVNINTLQVNFTGADAWTVTGLSDVYLKYGANTTTIKSTVGATGNTWSVNYTIAKNTNVTIEVYANIASTVYNGGAADTMITSLLVVGTTASSGQTVNTNNGLVLAGQTMTATVGAIASALDASTPTAKIVAGNTTQDAAVFKFTTTNDSYTLTQIVVKVVDATAASTIQNVILKDGATTIGTAPISGTSATFSGLTVPVAANTSKALTIALQLGSIGVGAGASGANIQVTLDSFKANNSQGVETVDLTDRAANVTYAYKAIPTISNVGLPSTALLTGTVTLSKFTIVNTGNTIGWKKLIFTVNKTGGAAGDPAISNAKIYDYDTNTEISGAVTITTLGELNTAGAIAFVATAEQQVSGTKTFVLKADVAGSLVTGDNVNTNITQPSGYVAPDTYANVALTAASLAWTDQSAASHSETTTDWNNGYLVKNLPTDSQTLTK